MLVRGSDVAPVIKTACPVLQPLQGEEHGHCSLNAVVPLIFFFFTFLVRDISFQKFWAGVLRWWRTAAFVVKETEVLECVVHTCVSVSQLFPLLLPTVASLCSGPQA